MAQEIKLAYSYFTKKIYAGKTDKNGELVLSSKRDITELAISLSARHLLQTNQKLAFEHQGKNYKMIVVEVAPKKKTKKNEHS